MYDFALYENITTAINHQKDLHMIARLLLDSGYSVCVLGYCKEQDLGDGIPFIHIPNPYKIPEMESGPKYTILFRQWNFCINKKKYIRHFLNATKGIAHNYYCGSFLNETDIKFFKQDPDANYFFWGLRSHYLSLNYDDFLHPISALDKLQKILFIKNHSNIKFFISNEIIREEFVKCGISSDRLILRPERYIDSTLTNHPSFDNNFSFLSIGTIRSEKRIPMAISAFVQLARKDIIYNIAGRCNDPKLSKQICELSEKDIRIYRNDSRLSEQEYQAYFDQCHFLLLCDTKQKSSVTNGTMMEALLKEKPIIAPNYDPYKYYIEKYHVGLLFDGTSVESLKSKMVEALNIGAEQFRSALIQFKKNYMYEFVQQQFKDELQAIGINPEK